MMFISHSAYIRNYSILWIFIPCISLLSLLLWSNSVFWANVRYEWWASPVMKVACSTPWQELACKSWECSLSEYSNNVQPGCGTCLSNNVWSMTNICRDNNEYGSGNIPALPPRGGDRGNFIEPIYTCSTNWNGSLRLIYHVSSGPYPPEKIIDMTINNVWFVKTWSPPYVLDNFFIKGCGCPNPMQWDQKITSSDNGVTLDFRPQGNGLPEWCKEKWNTWTTTPSPSPEWKVKGFLQRATCDEKGYITVRWWACDKKNPSSVISVNFYADSVSAENFIWRVIADVDMQQQAIKDECGGTSNHRFNDKTLLQPATSNVWPVADRWRDGKQHSLIAVGLWVERKDDGTLNYLDASSQYFTCPLPAWKTDTWGSNPPDTNPPPPGSNSWNENPSPNTPCGSSNEKVFSQKPMTGLCAPGAKLTQEVEYSSTCFSPGWPNGLCSNWRWSCNGNSCIAWEWRQNGNSQTGSTASGNTTWKRDVTVKLSLSWNILLGSLEWFDEWDTYSCFEIVEKASWENNNTYCSTNTTDHWQKLITGEKWWTYRERTWMWNETVWDNTLYPEWAYRMYWKNATGKKNSMIRIQILFSRWARIIGSLTDWFGEYWKSGTPYLSSESKMTGIRNTIQKNIASITRNTDAGKVVWDVVWYDADIVNWNSVNMNAKTVIVYGDLVIDRDISKTMWIIVLKDSTGKWGNIIIADNVKNIRGFIFAEWSIRGTQEKYGEKNIDQQLVLKGILYSQNTLGWSAYPEELFIYPRIPTTDADRAFIQDLNTIRSGNGWSTYLGTYIDAFIIDYDSSVITNPPPVFAP